MTNGLIGRKLGMTRVFAEDGTAVPVTIIEAGPCRVVQVRDAEVQLVGFGAEKKTVVTGVEMFRKLLDEGRAGDNVGLLLRGVERVMPGDNVQMTIELMTPIAMDEGLRFAIREGGRTVGAGVVATILK